MLMNVFVKQLQSVKENVVIFLDSLDQLSLQRQRGSVGWLPTKLHDNVKVIVSSLPGEEFNILPALKVSL